MGIVEVLISFFFSIVIVMIPCLLFFFVTIKLFVFLCINLLTPFVFVKRLLAALVSSQPSVLTISRSIPLKLVPCLFSMRRYF